MKCNKYVSRFESATIERQVEDVYNDILKAKLGDIQISYPYACDGYFETILDDKKPFRCICEFKYDVNMTSKIERSKVLAQVLFYLKRFEKNGKAFPNVVFIGDKNECFCMHTNELLKYLDFENVNWEKAPSSAGENADLVIALSEDEKLNIFVWDVNTDFDFDVIYNKMVDLASNTQRLIRVTEHNVDKVFKFFCEKVLKKSNKISANDLVALFFGCITDHENYYLHPSKKNMLVAERLGNVMVNGDVYNALMNTFAKTTSPKEKARLAALSDRLIEDTNRRRKGEFYTPTIWVDKSHSMIAANLGENWTDDYICWDCCAGTKNLTRDLKFKELYSSTLEHAELEISKNYNPEATSFRYDFLNDDFKRVSDGGKIPNGLMDAILNNKKILFYINPPYGRAGAVGGVEKGSTFTKVNDYMSKDRIEGSELIKQFLWRIIDIKRKFNLTNVSIAAFTKPSWLIKDRSESFRKLFLDHFNFVNGIMFCASEFADVSSAWGITFNIWNSGKSIDKNNFIHILCKSENDEIVNVGTKDLYNFDDLDIITTSDFVTRNLPKKKHVEGRVLCKNIKKWEFVFRDTKVYDDYLCNIHVHANDISNNGWTAITNVPSESGNDKNLTKSNIFESCIVHTIRTNTEASWINDKDMYNMNVNIPDEFKYDCFVNSIFGNYCCGYNVDGHKLKNEFFWMSNQEMKELAEEYEIDETYSDANGDSERFVCQKLQNIQLSAEAQAVLDAAKELVRKSMKYRKFFNDEHPEVQILNWDCGIYQIKQLCKEYLKDDWKKFEETRKALANKMRPMIKKLGFLK